MGAVRLIAVGFLLACLSGCALLAPPNRSTASEKEAGWRFADLVGRKVAPYQKQFLSKPGMALVESPKEQASMNHMFNAREGSMGGFGGAGGGCGCN